MSREQMIFLVTAHIATRGSTPMLEELLARLQGDKYTIFEFEHLEALSRVVFVYAKQPTQSK